MRRVLVVAGLLVTLAAGVHAENLKPGYVVCESGGQLRSFLDLQDVGALSPSPPQPGQTQQSESPPQGGMGQFGPSIQFDTKGVEFGPWVRRFIAQIKRNWLIPDAGMTMRGHVVLTFNVQKDGSIKDLTVLAPSEVETFTRAAYNALSASNPTQALPPEYPADKAFFTVTFYYNETPPEFVAPVPPSEPVNHRDASPAATVEDTTIEGLTQSDVRARFGHPNGVDVDPNGVTTWYYERPSQPTLKIYFVGGRASTKRPK